MNDQSIHSMVEHLTKRLDEQMGRLTNNMERRLSHLENTMGASTFVRNVFSDSPLPDRLDETFLRGNVLQSSPNTGERSLIPVSSAPSCIRSGLDHPLINFDPVPVTPIAADHRDEICNVSGAGRHLTFSIEDATIGQTTPIQTSSRIPMAYPHGTGSDFSFPYHARPSVASYGTTHTICTGTGRLPLTSSQPYAAQTVSNHASQGAAVPSTNQFTSRISPSTTNVGNAGSIFNPVNPYTKPVFPHKPQPYTGKVNWRDYYRQFEIVASRNGWSAEEKADMLAASLRDDALLVLSAFPQGASIEYVSLCRALDQRFGGVQGAYVTTFRLRTQKPKESITEFAFDLKRLALAAFTDCPNDATEKLVVSQFTEGLRDGNTQLMVQLSRPQNLEDALHTAMEVDARLNGNRTSTKGLFLVNEKQPENKRRKRNFQWPRRPPLVSQVQDHQTSQSTSSLPQSGNDNPSA